MNFFAGPLPVPHGFFTRNGGVSTGPYASLNCSFSGADDPANVQRNRALAATALGAEPKNLIGLKQVHGTTVIDFKTPFETPPAADAIVSTQPGYAVSVITADCAPVLFADEAATVIAAAHAGWRGALAGILEATVTAMRAKTAAPITAVIGPCIHQPSYEVAADLRDAILAHNPAAETFFTAGRPQRWQFDLPGYCQSRLQAIGIETTILPHDTCADEANFFSHRRRTLRGESAIGHQISVIKL